jgi:hypothetical protein
MPIDDELKRAVHDAIVKHGQPLNLEKPLIALLDELSAQGLTDERKRQRIELLIQAVDVSDVSLLDPL